MNLWNVLSHKIEQNNNISRQMKRADCTKRINLWATASKQVWKQAHVYLIITLNPMAVDVREE